MRALAPLLGYPCLAAAGLSLDGAGGCQACRQGLVATVSAVQDPGDVEADHLLDLLGCNPSARPTDLATGPHRGEQPLVLVINSVKERCSQHTRCTFAFSSWSPGCQHPQHHAQRSQRLLSWAAAARPW